MQTNESNVKLDEMNREQVFRMKGRVVLRHIGTDHLLVPVSGGVAQEHCVFPLNETGVFAWERLSQGLSLGATAQALAGEFEVELDAAQADCREYAAQLVAQRLLEEVSG